MTVSWKKIPAQGIKSSLILCALAFNLYAIAQTSPSPLTKTQEQLKQIDQKIGDLRRNLNSAHNKKGHLHKELANTEKEIGHAILKLRLLQQDMSSKEQKITELQHKISNLNAQLKTQQQLLAEHVRARYQIGEYQPLKWLLNQNDPFRISRLINYYQSVIQSRKQLIAQIDQTQIHLNENKQTLHHELNETQHLNAQLHEHQTQLEHNKRYHTQLIQSLNQDIQNKQNTIQEFQKNKENLSRLLQSLSNQNMQQSSAPFAKMQKKLPYPIQSKQRSLQSMNQGVTFFADEGTVVSAVYPGKVVFSDWLKGYGLLLIIDHGQGYMTLYAHNQSLFKKKGEMVYQNEQVASVGHSGGIRQNGLYFEIRQRGKAVPPLNWLS